MYYGRRVNAGFYKKSRKVAANFTTLHNRSHPKPDPQLGFNRSNAATLETSPGDFDA